MIEIISVIICSGIVSAIIIFNINKKLKANFNKELTVEIKKLKEQFSVDFEKEKKKIEFQASMDAKRTAKDDLSKWRNECEKDIRKDAIVKSRTITLGKVSEQLIPFFPNFNYNPKDARFLGSPTDLIIFDGLDDGDLKKIIFMEIKTGKAKLNKREEQVKEIIQNKQIEWLTIEMRDEEVENK